MLSLVMCQRGTCIGYIQHGVAYGDRADEEAPRREVEMVGCRMLLHWSGRDYVSRVMVGATSFCAVNESGDRLAMSGWRCHWCGCGSGIGRLLSCSGFRRGGFVHQRDSGFTV